MQNVSSENKLKEIVIVCLFLSTLYRYRQQQQATEMFRNSTKQTKNRGQGEQAKRRRNLIHEKVSFSSQKNLLGFSNTITTVDKSPTSDLNNTKQLLFLEVFHLQRKCASSSLYIRKAIRLNEILD